MKFTRNISHEEALKHFKDGDKVKVTLGTSKVTTDDAIITIEGDRLFICQNKVEGDHCDDKKGFKYSYVWDERIIHIEHLVNDEVINKYELF